jgi:predicted RNA-binding protein YlxR (DUF448 family)
MNGRGVYLCRSLTCFDFAMKKRRLTHALGVSATPEELADLREAYANEIGCADAAEVSE